MNNAVRDIFITAAVGFSIPWGIDFFFLDTGLPSWIMGASAATSFVGATALFLALRALNSEKPAFGYVVEDVPAATGFAYLGACFVTHFAAILPIIALNALDHYRL